MNILKNIPLSDILWYKIGGTTQYLLQAEKEKDIEEALDFIEKKHISKLFICGLGSNLIFSDDYFEGAILQIVKNKQKEPQITQNSDGIVTSFAGELLDDLIQFSFKHNLIGLQWAGGLPGTVGAGVRGNVGAFGGEIKEKFLAARVVDTQSKPLSPYTIKRENFNFSYRHSIIKENKNLIVTSATFLLQPGSVSELEKAREIYEKNIDYRQTHHPLEYPTCGSVFKNISKKEEIDKIIKKWPDIAATVENKWHGKVSMGYIIHRLGLTGYKVGNMQISTKHSNFIINLGGAKAHDVKTIIYEIQNRVTESFGFTPEVEVEIVE
jgi:UDP-N-acetylmuramate dehydrogenase